MERNLSTRQSHVNEAYFGFSELPEIKWSKGRIQKRYRKITFGCYDFKKNEIRIHPVLNHLEIPVFVLDFVIYHELLHFEDRDILLEQYQQKKSIFRRSKRGKNKVHTPHFHQREKEFIDKKEAGNIMQSIARGTYFQSKIKKESSILELFS